MRAVHVVVMGVSGCGKSAVGEELSQMLGLSLVEGDDFHPPGNIAKMRQGLALDDTDRAGWLRELAAQLAQRPEGAVLTCSALKRAYRDTLRTGAPHVRFVHLALGQAQAMERVAARSDHFYPPSLVASQFEALEDPSGEAGVLVVDATRPVEALVREAAAWLGQFNNP